VTTSLIVAAARNDVIGSGGSLPWYLPDDLRRFRRLTTGHPVVAGRVTHESILARLGHPLPDRTSIVVSSRSAGAGAGEVAGEDAAGGVVWVGSLVSAIRAARKIAIGADSAGGEIFVIGGASVYQQALPYVDRIYLTRLHREVAGDTVMPPGWLDGFALTGAVDRPARGAESAYSFLDYVRETS
jgi:dihydrofolate reductase